MEKAILQTLIYADIFDYPLKAWEIHKWLLKKKVSLPQVEKGLLKLLKQKKIMEKQGYYALASRKSVISKRIAKIKSSEELLQEARFFCKLFKIIPWIKLVGISGNLSMDNATDEDDIDLFVITEQKRLWLTRLSMLFILILLERRRTKSDTKKEAAKKFCLNLLLEEDQLEQQQKDLYIAHEVLQMKPLWQRGEIYEKFLLANEWVFQFLPNWTGGRIADSQKQRKMLGWKVVDWLETGARILQRRYMGKPKFDEQISDKALYFHPEDSRPRVLKEFQKRIKKYI